MRVKSRNIIRAALNEASSAPQRKCKNAFHGNPLNTFQLCLFATVLPDLPGFLCSPRSSKSCKTPILSLYKWWIGLESTGPCFIPSRRTRCSHRNSRRFFSRFVKPCFCVSTVVGRRYVDVGHWFSNWFARSTDAFLFSHIPIWPRTRAKTQLLPVLLTQMPI